MVGAWVTMGCGASAKRGSLPLPKAPTLCRASVGARAVVWGVMGAWGGVGCGVCGVWCGCRCVGDYGVWCKRQRCLGSHPRGPSRRLERDGGQGSARGGWEGGRLGEVCGVGCGGVRRVCVR